MKSFKEKTCLVCGKVFTPTSPTQKVCENQECKCSYKRLYENSRYREKAIKYDKVCEVCGEPYITSHGRSFVCRNPSCKRVIRTDAVRTYRKRVGGERSKKTLEEVKHEFLEYGFTVNQDFYVNNLTKISCICPNNHTFEISRANFQKGRGCPFCWDDGRKIGIDFVKREFLY